MAATSYDSRPAIARYPIVGQSLLTYLVLAFIITASEPPPPTGQKPVKDDGFLLLHIRGFNNVVLTQSQEQAYFWRCALFVDGYGEAYLHVPDIPFLHYGYRIEDGQAVREL